MSNYRRSADPVGALLGMLDRRVKQSAPSSYAQLATIVEVEPDLIVKFDTGQQVKNPFVLLVATVYAGGRCVMLPLQEGHDFALLPVFGFVGSSS